jgi:hypothetical protein
MLPDNVTRWRPLAAQSAAKWGKYYGVNVPVSAVLGIIGHESGGNPNALNADDKGQPSRGLMQVREPTAHGLGLADATQLFQPAVGIDVGTHYLARMLKLAGGDVPTALGMYAGYKLSTIRQGAPERIALIAGMMNWVRLDTGTTAPGPTYAGIPLVPGVEVTATRPNYAGFGTGTVLGVAVFLALLLLLPSGGPSRDAS